MSTIPDSIAAQLDPANLGLSDISFGQPGQDVAAFASTVGAELQARFAPAGGTAAGVDALRRVLPASSSPPAAAGAPYSAIYAFGDSLSDTGNVKAATFGAAPISPYDDGRFSNGPLWVEDLAARLGVAAPTPSLQGGTDFAYGGAETGATAAHGETPIDLPGQLTQFKAQVSTPDPNALYTVWIGGNDIMDAVRAGGSNPQQAHTAIDQAAANEGQFLTALADNGARHILVMSAPDLGATPYEQNGGQAQAALAAGLSWQYNQDLAQQIATLEQSHQVSVDMVDTYALLDSAFTNPAAYGFSNVRDPVWTGGFTPGSGGTLQASGAAQNQYLFFDTMHPTAAAQSIVANVAAQSLGVA